jgi:hypothetical protein
MSDLMWTISNSLINVVDAFFLTMIPWTMTESKRKKRYAFATILILFFILNICNAFVIGSVASIIGYSSVYLLVLLATRDKYLKTTIWITIAIITQIVIDISMASIQTVASQKPDYLTELYAQKSPAFIASCLFVKAIDILFFIIITKRKTNLFPDDKSFIYYLTLPVLSAIIGLIMTNQVVNGQASGTVFLLLTVFILLCNVLSIMLIRSAAKNTYEVEQAKAQAKINQMDRMQYIKLAEKSDSIRAWKHDVRQVMNGALTMIQQGRDEEAELILKSKLSTMQVETTAIKSGNIIVDAILTKMVDECFDKNIPLIMRAEIPSAIMSEDDTCEVLGTLLDSAIDVSCKQNDRKIDFMMQGGEQFRIQISTNAVLYSDKEKNALKETENRISKVLSKYNGIVSAKYDDEQKVVVWTLLVPLQKDIGWLTTYVYDTTDVVGETGNEQTEKELV